jgi:hypothetical protein
MKVAKIPMFTGGCDSTAARNLAAISMGVAMRGDDEIYGSLFSYIDLDTRVRGDHPLRPIRKIANAALAAQSSSTRTNCPDKFSLAFVVAFAVFPFGSAIAQVGESSYSLPPLSLTPLVSSGSRPRATTRPSSPPRQPSARHTRS